MSAFLLVGLLVGPFDARAGFCDGVVAQKILILSGTTLSGKNELEQLPFQIFVTLDQVGGGSVFQKGLQEGSSDLEEFKFDDIVMSSPLQAFGTYSETVRDAHSKVKKHQKYLSLFDRANREGGEVTIQFFKTSESRVQTEVGRLVSIRGQPNAFKGTLRTEALGITARSFLSLPYNNSLIYSFPVVLENQTQAKLSINLFEHSIDLITAESSQKIYFSRFKCTRAYSPLDRDYYGFRIAEIFGGVNQDRIIDTFIDLFSERASNMKFFSLTELVLEISNEGDSGIPDGTVSGTLLPEGRLSGTSFLIL